MALVIALVTAGCAIGRVYPDGRIIGVALGHAELAWSGVASSPVVPLDAAGYPSAAFCSASVPETVVSTRIQGGDLSSNVPSTVSIIGSTLVAIFAGGLAF